MTIDSDAGQFSRNLRSAILWPVSVIFLTAFLLLLLVFQLFQFVKWADHSYAVIEQAMRYENQVIGLQNQVRGYFLTGDSVFIGSFDKEQQAIDGALTQLKDLVQDNPPQVVRAEEIIQAKNAWLDEVRTVIAQHPQGASSDANGVMAGKNLMDEVIRKFDAFVAVEEDLRQERQKKVRRMEQILIYAGGGLSILLAVSVGQVVRRHFIRLASDYRTALSTIERRQAELEEQKEWFRVTLSSIGDGVIVTDQEGRIVFMNYEAERLTEWKEVEAHLKPLPLVFKIVNEETRNPVTDPVAMVFQQRKVVGLANHTVLISSRDQEWPIEDSAAPIFNVEGKILGVVLVFHDATKARRAQNMLKAYSEDLEKKVAERTASLRQTVTEMEAFSYTISHDLRSPLRAMQGFAEAILEDYADKMDDRGKGYLERIKNAAERLDRLIQDLLAYTRLARQDAPFVALDLDKCIRDIIEHYPNLNTQAAQIEIMGTLPKVLGREAALTQVISNLLGNAAKFVATGTIPHIKVWCEDNGPRVRLRIQDNGIGIAQRDFDRIFQMFVQINEATLYGGTGIGLAIVKKAAQTMQGTIGLESEEGKGSIFWVELNKA